MRRQGLVAARSIAVGTTATLQGQNTLSASRRTSSKIAPTNLGDDTNEAGACGIFRTNLRRPHLRQLVWTAGNRAFITPRALPPADRRVRRPGSSVGRALH